MLNLVGFEPYDRKQFEKEEESKRRARLTGIGAQADKPRRRDINSLDSVDFGAIPPYELPEVIREAEAEHSRAGGFERVFPSPSPAKNDEYLKMFEAQRYDNVLLCHWARHTAYCAGDRSARASKPSPRPPRPFTPTC